MSWRRPEERYERQRSPVWEPRRSQERERRRDSPQRDRFNRDRESRDRRDRFERKDRFDRERPTDRDRDRFDRERSRDARDTRDRRDRDRDRRRSPQRSDDRDMPNPPSPPKISFNDEEEQPQTKSRSTEREEKVETYDNTRMDGIHDEQSVSPGDWLCKCGSYNFKRRMFCFRRNCNGKRDHGTVLSGAPSESGGITKKLLFRRLDALTTEDKILEEIKERCTKEVLDSISGITIGRETLTGASKCLAYICFNTIADSTAALNEFTSLDPPLVIDNRQVQISYYNEPVRSASSRSKEYASYYQTHYNSASQRNLSEADRVNAAAAVAQSAITAAQARHSWTPTSAPTFVSSNTQASAKVKVPTGDGKTVYTAPDVRTFMYDETSGYYYDPATGLYYDGTTQYFFNNQINQYMYWDATSNTYLSATPSQQNTDQPKLPQPPQISTENTIAKDPPEEKKKKDKEDKVKVAKKIAKDMERWARTLNQRKENAKSNIVMEQPLDMGPSKGSADIGFSVLGAGPATVAGPSMTRELSPPATEEFLMKKPEANIDDDEGIIDWAKLTCLLCKRKFPSAEVLTKHKVMSDLHKQNLAEFRKQNDQPQMNGYRDRAAERRMKFGEDDVPIRKRYEPPEPAAPSIMSAPAPSVVDTIGGKMLQKMGWSHGKGLGKEEQGRVAPIEAEQRPSLAGLGQKRGIYTPTPGETYRDTVKKLMIARYKEVVGEEDN